ncbi:hypothetical protein M9Y10_000057 [Tritrichomonas musculus]|uniref:Uncharacterized protein n=1 Tax=Tritrichomonas musculus TaxID=1915356 RepID=A0ABR2L3C9_9EUKA
MAGGPIPAIKINSQADYEQSMRNIDDMYKRLHIYDEDEGGNESTNINDYKYFELFTHAKPIKFDNLTIFRGVMRIGDFMKIGRITDDDRLDAFVSISPGTVFRFYDDDGNDILINGFATNDELTWDANHVVLGNVLKDHLKNNYALKSELPSILKNSELQLNLDEELTEEVQQKLLNDDKPLSAQASYVLTAFAASESAAMVLNNCAEQYVSKNDVARHTGKMEVSINFEVDNTGQVVNCRLSKDSKFMEIAKRDGIYVACSSSYPSGYYTWKTNISREDSIDFQSEVSSSCWFRVYYNGKIEGVGSVPPTNFTEFYVLYDDISMIPTIDFIQSNYALKSELPEPVDLTPYYTIKVDDSSGYSLGSEVFIDCTDNKLKILSGETAITSKIRRTTVGIITSIINETTLAVFKS